MAQKASEIQKQRIQEIEMKADELVKKSEIMFVSLLMRKVIREPAVSENCVTKVFGIYFS